MLDKADLLLLGAQVSKKNQYFLFDHLCISLKTKNSLWLLILIGASVILPVTSPQHNAISIVFIMESIYEHQFSIHSTVSQFDLGLDIVSIQLMRWYKLLNCTSGCICPTRRWISILESNVDSSAMFSTIISVCLAQPIFPSTMAMTQLKKSTL